jgi:hypothetical protein
MSVAGLAYYYYRKFSRQNTADSGKYQTLIGKYDHAKKLFFGVLTVSCLLEIPAYIGCLAYDGPTDCEWHYPDEILFWFFHLLALCGYACCIIIPCVLWSDMINKQDGKLFFSSYPYDCIKRYFQVMLLLYFFNSSLDILMTCVYYKMSNRVAYQDAPTYSVCALIECILIVFISVGCLYCGIQLQMYVHSAKLNANVEIKFLFTLNLILFVIVLSFLGRAILVLRFAPNVPKSFKNPVNYVVYTIIARWTPDVFCQLLLIYIMRLSGNEILAKNSTIITQPQQNRMSGFFGKKDALKDPLLSDEYQPDSEELRASFEESLLPVLKMAEKYSTKSRSMKSGETDLPTSHENTTQGTVVSDPIPIKPTTNTNSSNNSHRISSNALIGSYEEPASYSPTNSYKYSYNSPLDRRFLSSDYNLDQESL